MVQNAITETGELGSDVVEGKWKEGTGRKARINDEGGRRIVRHKSDDKLEEGAQGRRVSQGDREKSTGRKKKKKGG